MNEDLRKQNNPRKKKKVRKKKKDGLKIACPAQSQEKESKQPLFQATHLLASCREAGLLIKTTTAKGRPVLKISPEGRSCAPLPRHPAQQAPKETESTQSLIAEWLMLYSPWVPNPVSYFTRHMLLDSWLKSSSCSQPKSASPALPCYTFPSRLYQGSSLLHLALLLNYAEHKPLQSVFSAPVQVGDSP